MAIVVSLDEAATGRRIWSQEFSGLKQDLLTVQDQIYSGLLSAFDLKLSNEELAKSTAHFTENVGAYELYLKGRSLLRSGQRDEKTSKQALALFNGATLERSWLHSGLHRNRGYLPLSLLLEKGRSVGPEGSGRREPGAGIER